MRSVALAPILAICLQFVSLVQTHGAEPQDHWAFRVPHRPALPRVQSQPWSRNGIDYFVLARLEKEKLQPSPEADKATLFRRVSLDLTGLPPTPSELDAFLSDNSPKAYEKIVDRLLASSRFGERMAILWLDAARYADTSGYQTDGERYMWRWRDWVIDAFNQNMPFDQFTIEQIAGDLLPGATLDQRIATGFNRNHRGNSEGGIIAEEYAVEYVVDRVDTTCTVWLGLTMGCARCHDHKYDPFTQKEYYQLFAFFNNVPEKGRAIKLGNSPPVIKAPTPAQVKTMQILEDELATAERQFRALEPEILSAQANWERSLVAQLATAPAATDGTERVQGDLQLFVADWTVSDSLTAHFPLDGLLLATNHVSGSNAPAAIKFAAGDAAFAPGKLGQAAAFDGQRFVDAGKAGDFGFLDKFSFTAWIFPQGSHAGAILSRTGESPESDGYSLCLTNGRVQLNLVKRWLDDALRVETEMPLTPNAWHHVAATYDGSRVADGIRIYVDGKPEKLKVNLDELNQSFKTSEPFRIGSGGGPEIRFRGLIDDVRIYDRVLMAQEAAIVATANSIAEILSLPPERRGASQALKLRSCFLDKHAPAPILDAKAKLADSRKRRDEFAEGLPTLMVMEEMQTPRDTFVLVRGQYDKPGEHVRMGVPNALRLPVQGDSTNRLALARWLVDSSNPLTARVAINQYWQMLFGTGLVKTVEDFGTRGELPSHPELMDWLATEFMRTGWNVKAMLKLIVMSATYRQSSKVTPSLLQKDPDNRWLARGPRFRLSADAIRDQAFAISGLLVEKLGGPSVKPYQPAGLWKELSGTDYVPDKGEKLYRRSLYTFWKRTSPPPTMTSFDAAGREACSVRQSRTSTPLQALDMMNDTAFLEAARAFAQRIMLEGGVAADERLAYAFRLATARRPGQHEQRILLDAFRDHLEHFGKHPERAVQFVSVGELPKNDSLPAAELAAYASVASLILNLDETVTKQ
ncbi:MAG: DUF1553 domain-containing protein [Verrucomicrobia bacterium]|nr:DUF1553 domain-containing protein [Verrucomicrobiota bacterium]